MVNERIARCRLPLSRENRHLDCSSFTGDNVASVIRRRSSSYWTAFFRDETGRLHCRSTKETDEGKARQIAAQYEQASRTRRTVNQVVRVIEELQKLIDGDSEEKPMAFLTKKRGASGAESPYWQAVLTYNGRKIWLSTKCRDKAEARKVSNYWSAAAVLAQERRFDQMKSSEFKAQISQITPCPGTINNSQHLFDGFLADKAAEEASIAVFEKKLFRNAANSPWMIKLMSRGERHTFCTNKFDRKEAAFVAREIRNYLRVNGMAATMEAYSWHVGVRSKLNKTATAAAKELSTFVIGYLLAALESVAASQQISANVRTKVQADLEYARPIIAKIWQLDAVRTEYEQEMKRQNNNDNRISK